tara:strand:+ start:801 stop:1160 length:360 start_codon:yes stop_codon:yes gene_type:complete
VEGTRQISSYVFIFSGNNSLVVGKMDDGLILYFLIVYSVVQIVFIGATAAWAFKIRRELNTLHALMWDINNEIVHHAVAMTEAGMIPLPWEDIMEDLQDPMPDTTARRNGNVYYLGDDD